MSYPAEILAEDPRLYWRLGDFETGNGDLVRDASRYGNDGEHVTARARAEPVAGLVPGDLDGALRFFSTDHYVVSRANFTATPAFTMGAIVQLAAPAAGSVAEVFSIPTNRSEIQLAISGTAVSLSWWSGGEHYTSDSYELPIGVPNVLVATYDGVDARIYADGELVVTSPRLGVGPDWANGGAPFYVGLFSGMFDVTVDEVYWASSAIPAERVAIQYAETIVAAPPPRAAFSRPVMAAMGVPGCFTAQLGSLVLDEVTVQNGVLWGVELLEGWWDSEPVRFETAEAPTNGTTVVIARPLARTINLTAFAFIDSAAIGNLAFTAIAAMKAVVEPALATPITMTVTDPAGALSVKVRLGGVMKSQIVGALQLVRFVVPLLAPDPALA